MCCGIRFLTQKGLCSGGLILITLMILIIFLRSINDFDISYVFSQYSNGCDENGTDHLNKVLKIGIWESTGHTTDEQKRLSNFAKSVGAWSDLDANTIPTVPCLSADNHLLVLSVAASRLRYGGSLTFVMVSPIDVRLVLPKNNTAEPLYVSTLNLWCIFEDGSFTPGYGYDKTPGNERVSLLDCSLSTFAAKQLWVLNRSLKVYLVSLSDKALKLPILKAMVHVSKQLMISSEDSRYQLTLCTSPLHYKGLFLKNWIEFHRLVGFRKFVIYNATDASRNLSDLIDHYRKRHPGLVDIVQWSFSGLFIKDVDRRRHFQVEAAHDCLVRYGDQSEWLGMIDLDEYLVPMPQFKTITECLMSAYNKRAMGSVLLLSQFYCTKNPMTYTLNESDKSRPAIERFTFRAQNLSRNGYQKYLYRPRFVQLVGIHRQSSGLDELLPSNIGILLAHYSPMAHPRTMPGYLPHEYVEDTSVLERYGKRLQNALNEHFS